MIATLSNLPPHQKKFLKQVVVFVDSVGYSLCVLLLEREADVSGIKSSIKLDEEKNNGRIIFNLWQV